MKPKIIFTIQARLNSSRLPGKTLMRVAGKTILEWLVERVAQAKKVDQIVVATSTEPSDDKIVELCIKKKIDYFRGPKADVLGRVHQTVEKYGADATLRIGPDDPYIDGKLIDQFCDIWLKTKADYVLNFLEPTYPWGINIDLLSANFLRKLNKEVKDPYDREHVSPYMIRNRKKIKIAALPKLKENLTSYRLTIDYPEDLEVARKILNHFKGSTFDYIDIVKFLDKNPKIKSLNSQYLPKVKVNAGD